MSSTLFKEVMDKYYAIKDKGDSTFSLDFQSYDFKVDSTIAGLDPWFRAETEYTCELTNLYNKFTKELFRLHVLNNIIREYEPSIQPKLRYEFTVTALYYCLHQPNEYRNRMIYFCTHLCHYANLMTQKEYKDDLADDKYIDHKVLSNVSRKWKSSVRLIKVLDLLGNRNKEFKDNTNDFRDKAQHRQPPSLELGLTGSGLTSSVKRIRKNGNPITEDEIQSSFFETNLFSDFQDVNQSSEVQEYIVYQLSATQPLESKDILPILIQQGENMQSAFKEYWKLVKEHHLAISQYMNMAE